MALTNIFSFNKKKPTQLSLGGVTPAYGMPQMSYSAAGASAAKTTPEPIRSVATPQSSQNSSSTTKQIQGSGYGSNYASNQSNYKAPTYTPPAYTPPSPTPTASSTYLASAQAAGDRQKTFAEQKQQQQQQYIKDSFGLANSQLKEALPAAQQVFGQFKTNAEASIADLLAGGERQKAQAADYQAEAQRAAAQTLRETQGQNQRTFANLNTLDSRGEGSFGQATENTTSEFNRFTQQGLKALADKKAEIDSTVATAERNARATITTEEAKMNQLARDIQYALANNSLEEAKQLTTAYNETQQYIYDIEDALTETKYQFELEQQKLNNELAKIQSFSPEFMAGGPPTNQAEYEFFIKNQKDIQSVTGAEGNQSSNKVNGIIDQLAGMNTRGITGLMRFGITDESRNAEGLLKQLSSELQVEEAKRLKGQGAMSDAERALLANSVASFNLDENGKPRVSDDRFQQILQELRTGFSSGSAQGGIDPAVQAYLAQNGL